MDRHDAIITSTAVGSLTGTHEGAVAYPELEATMTGNLTTILSCKENTVVIHPRRPTTVIGERINPTGRKIVQEALQAGKFDQVRRDAVEQVAAGALVLDVNAGVPGLDEAALLPELVRVVLEEVTVPLCFDSTNPKALGAALAVYPGKALVNSVNGEERSLQAILPLVKEHKAAVIGLCMDEDGIPLTAEGRLMAAARVIERAGRFDINLENIIIDPMTMALGTNSHAARVTLEAIRLVVEEFGVNICMGASNISLGLPDRKFLNAAFLAMAIHAGLTCPITNPLIPEIRMAILAADLIMDRDEQAARWIEAYRQREKTAQVN
jgi:5-methyltetrahydrofolate--homocysteine methyltransferase